MSSHRVTAILVLHDGATWLYEVVASLTSQSRSIDAILAVDTGSLDSSAQLVSGARISVLPLKRDAGFGEAVSHAVSTLPATVNGTTEWLWIVHDDLSLHPNALENLITEVQNRPNVAMAGPKLLSWHDRTNLLEIGISIAANGNRWTNLEPAEYDQGQRDGVQEVLAVSTAGALIRRDIFEQLGGFDKNLDLFRDDVDFGWRLHSLGFTAISVSEAIGYHAEASANERRSVDVAEAFLHRPLLLDRRNAAYVLLVNSSWWRLPSLALQLLFGAIYRSVGFLFAKLPGYASDEILAVGALLLQPGELITARALRRKERLVPASVALKFIPSRWSQIRLSFSRNFQKIRNRIFPDEITEVTDNSLLEEAHEDDELLTPATKRPWTNLIKRPLVASYIFLFVLTALWSRQRFGSISGGALAEQPSGVSDLWNIYFAGWHPIAMGTGASAPPWLAMVAIAATPLLASVKLFMTALFFFAPLLMAFSAHQLLKRVVTNGWLVASAAVLYALSPVSISAINSGRLSTVVILILTPLFLIANKNWFEIENYSWRRIFGNSLFAAVLFAFSPIIFILGILITGYSIFRDYLASERGAHLELFNTRLYHRITLLITPLLICAPWSFELIINPARYLLDAGFLIPGGGANWAAIANPGGAGALPWYLISPISIVLLISLFSSTAARFVAELGFVSLLLSILTSALTVTGNGTSVATPVYPGTLLALTTIAAVTSGVILLDKWKERLAQTHFNFRHISAALLVFVIIFYSAASTTWLVSNGNDSILKTSEDVVLPPFLAIETSAKIMVVRPRTVDGEVTLNFYIARGGDATLGQPDTAPKAREQITNALRDLTDGSGLTASMTLGIHGIKYLFLKNPVDENLVRIVDGLGGFERASSTSVGIVWKVSGLTGNIIFTDDSGKNSILAFNEESSEVNVSVPGSITLTEEYARGWRAMQDGIRLEKTRSVNSMPTFKVTEPGTISIFYDGTIRRAWVSLEFIIVVIVIILALPAGRRRREIEDEILA
jgi:GT2 family glycosyltransferase